MRFASTTAPSPVMSGRAHAVGTVHHGLVAPFWRCQSMYLSKPRACAEDTQRIEKDRELYPPSEAYTSGRLAVEGADIYYECRGNPGGIPVVYAHGGPGACTFPRHAQFFGPGYLVCLTDQRGCGRSNPRGILRNNDTWKLVDDLEALRQHLGFNRWIVAGGSWGVALACAYALKHPTRVSGLILRGLCLMRKNEMEWFMGGGLGALRPVQYSDFVRHAVPGAVDPFDIGAPLILRGYLRLLTSPDASVRAGAAEAWGRWERAAIAGGSGVLIRGPQAVSPPASRLGVTETSPGGSGEEWGSGGEAPDIGAFAQDMSHGQVQALLTCWYSLNLGFGVGEELMRHPERLRGIPCIAVQGADDLTCPPRTAFEMQQALPDMELRIVSGAGHSMYDPKIRSQLVDASDRMLNLSGMSIRPPPSDFPSAALC